MRTGNQIASAYSRRHRWQGDDYIDAEGYKYERWSRSSSCLDCIFRIRAAHKNETVDEKNMSSGFHCLIFDEKGMSRKDQKNRTGFKIKSGKDCSFYFHQHFSEGDREDEELRDEIEKIASARGFLVGSTSGIYEKEKEKSTSWVWFAIGLFVLYIAVS